MPEVTSDLRAVFGENVTLDAKGNPIEQGIGSPKHKAELEALAAKQAPLPVAEAVLVEAVDDWTEF